MGRIKDKSRTTADELRKHAEELLSAKTKRQHQTRTEGDPLRLIHELEVHEIELEIQNAELRQARDELESALGNYTDLYDFAPVAYFNLDQKGEILALNFSGASLLGAERSRLIGKRLGLFIVDELRTLFSEFLRKVFSSAVNESCEVRFTNNGDTPVFVQVEAIAFEKGRECRLSVFDISERKRIEENLRKSEQNLVKAQGIAQIGNWEWDQVMDKITGSAEFYRIFGHNFTSYGEFINLVHPDDREVVNKKVQDTLDNQSPYNIHYRIVPPDGTLKIIHAIGQAIPDDAGNVVRMVGTAQNITERRRTEESLSKKRQELGELNRSLELRINNALEELRQKDQMMILQERQALMGEMINNIAHQWRQPLNSLGLVMQQLPIYHDTGDLSGELLKEKIAKGMELIQHMSQTIEDFRRFFRSDKEKITFEVNQVIKHTLSLIEQGFREQQIRIAVRTDDNSMIAGYPNEYAQVLLNILMNARDELINNKVDAALISLCAFTEGVNTVVTVTDNAGGISGEIMDRIFDPYFTTKGPDKGTGLGLFMSKTIIEKNMGGRISARNTGSGAEFRIEVNNADN